MNPWQQTVLDRSRGVIRFSLWVALALHAAMLAVFSIAFTFQFLRHLWLWCGRTLFRTDW